jgi:hypothetical protein
LKRIIQKPSNHRLDWNNLKCQLLVHSISQITAS